MNGKVFKLLNDIFVRFKYGNAVTNDLWTALAEVAEGGLDIKAIMDTWTRQMGYPVLQVQPPTAFTPPNDSTLRLKDLDHLRIE